MLDAEMMQDFYNEARENLQPVIEQLQSVLGAGDSEREELINALFREIHTIKGMAGFLDLNNFTSLAHSMETLLDCARKENTFLTQDMISTLIEAADMLDEMLDNLDESHSISINHLTDKLSLYATNKAPEVIPQEKVEVQESEKELLCSWDLSEINFLTVSSDFDHYYLLKLDLFAEESKGRDPLTVYRELKQTGEVLLSRTENVTEVYQISLNSYPIQILYATRLDENTIYMMTGLEEDQVQFLPDLSKISKETLEDISSRVGEESLEDISSRVSKEAPSSETVEIEKVEVSSPEEVKSVAHEASVELMPSAPRISVETQKPPEESPETSPAVDLTPTARPSEPNYEKAVSKETTKENLESSVRINLGLLDKLMGLASELVLIRNQQILSSSEVESGLRATFQRLDVVTTEIQETIMKTRMQPVGKTFTRFGRVVRNLAKSLGKKIQLEMEGLEVELDRTILESLVDPLTHMIRNSCDHGIEDPATRHKSGKASIGKLYLRAFHRAGQIHIEIQDDGAGLNAQKIKTKAIENKLKTFEELEGMSTKEIYQLIMLPGFSTAETITNTSGRGVGMDVVRQKIEEHNGSLEIDSDSGKGTRFTIKLPLTMAIIPSLIVEAGQERFAIPQVNLQEVIQFYDEDAQEAFEKVGNSQVCRIRDHVYPLVHLRDLLQLQGSTQSSTTGTCVLLLKLGKDNFCMTVDKVCTTEEIVIKPMYSLLKSLPFYSGATVMGDGDVALILDIPSIAKCLQLNLGEKVVTEDLDERADSKSIDASSYLFFESSSTECFGLPLDSIQRIEKISHNKIQTVGNRQLTSIQDQNYHVLQLCEIYDVSPCNQQEELFLILPKNSSSPLGILASKILDIEELQFLEEWSQTSDRGIRGTFSFKERVISLLDPEYLLESSQKIIKPHNVVAESEQEENHV